MKQPKRSPWGPVDSWRVLAPGVASVGTPSHGGIKLGRANNAKVPEPLRRRGGWYEEDCEWAIACMYFPAAFNEVERRHAQSVVKNYWPDEYTAATGKPVKLEESYVLRQRKFEAEAKFRFVVRAAWGEWAEWVPSDMVGVCARRASDGAERYYVIPESDYRAKDPHNPFVVDELRHAEVPDPFAKRSA